MDEDYKYYKTVNELLRTNRVIGKSYSRLVRLRKVQVSLQAVSPIQWRRRFVVSLSWLTAAGTLVMLAVIRPYQPSDILLAIAGGYTMAFNVFVAKRYLNRSFA